MEKEERERHLEGQLMRWVKLCVHVCVCASCTCGCVCAIVRAYMCNVNVADVCSHILCTVTLSHASHMPLTCLSLASHVPLMCLSRASHMPLTCLSHASHMPLTCLSRASHMPLTCLSHALLHVLLLLWCVSDARKNLHACRKTVIMCRDSWCQYRRIAMAS